MLTSTGKTVEDLRDAVEKLARRKTLFAQITAANEAEAQKEEINRKMSELNVELEAAQQKHRDATAPLIWQHEQIRELWIQARAAETQLRRDCEDTEALDAVAGIHGRIQDAAKAIAKVKEKLWNSDANINDLTARIAEGGANEKAYRKNLESAHERRKSYEAEEEQLRTLAAQLTAEMDEAQARLIEP